MAQLEAVDGRRERILRTIHEHMEQFGRPPTFRQIQDAVGLQTTSAVSYQLKKLEALGLLQREPRMARSLSLTAKGLALVGGAGAAARRVRETAERVRSSTAQALGVIRFQIQGDIGASLPMEMGNGDFATYDEDDAIAIDAGSLPKRTENLFAVRVRGNSMIDALISDRDVVIMQKLPDGKARDGDMVAAWLRQEQELTLKHYFLEGDKVRLQPANPTMGPIYSAADNVEVQGRVVTVIRQANGRGVR